LQGATISHTISFCPDIPKFKNYAASDLRDGKCYFERSYKHVLAATEAPRNTGQDRTTLHDLEVPEKCVYLRFNQLKEAQHVKNLYIT
jgi:hypothetical protein